ncbi:glucose-6-phosphate dehydrogenase 4 [Actinidia rufa]|uniref:Glucose-6-phosphate dehydrogenase 4 n=1 Tax=Actinidia rufa TaxID=165716 RepID=A0A7J0ERX5_9ERIC|nr:glucose-6-phosphate dehydrogenase 4 [Actinidia rufa]
MGDFSFDEEGLFGFHKKGCFPTPEPPSCLPQIRSSSPEPPSSSPSLGIAVIIATGELERGKIFPALFALYYSGFLPEFIYREAAVLHGIFLNAVIKLKVEIRIQFRHVPGNLYYDRIGHNIDLATNELVLCDMPDEAILVRVNNKIPGLSLQLDASELNLLYKDRYLIPMSIFFSNIIDGDNHLFMRRDELGAAWNILSPVLQEMDKKNTAPELYELGGRGPVGAFYL